MRRAFKNEKLFFSQGVVGIDKTSNDHNLFRGGL